MAFCGVLESPKTYLLGVIGSSFCRLIAVLSPNRHQELQSTYIHTYIHSVLTRNIMYHMISKSLHLINSVTDQLVKHALPTLRAFL